MYRFAVKIDMIKTSEISTEETVGLNDTRSPFMRSWWHLLVTQLAPRYFEELSSTPKYFVFIESGTMLLITLVVHSSYWKLSQLFGHLAKSKTSNSNKLPHLHIIGNRSDHSLYYSVLQLTVATIVLLNGEWIIRINLLMSAVSHAGYKGFFLLLGFSVHLVAFITAINRCIYKISKNEYRRPKYEMSQYW